MGVYAKNRLKLMLETVINSYYRGTTQFDELSTLSCTNIHAEMITGSVPVTPTDLIVKTMLYTIKHFGSPSKGHSTNPSILQSHHLQLSEISGKVYSSFSSVLKHC